jgi:hypothetical protein
VPDNDAPDAVLAAYRDRPSLNPCKRCNGSGSDPGGESVTIPVAEYERLDEIRAEREGTFPRCLIVKPERDRDLYVGWSDSTEMPAGIWTRAEAVTEGCPRSRLRRADEQGTSSLPGFYDWGSSGMIAEQRGWLPRARLLAYATAWLDGRESDAFDLLEPFEGETEVRRG